MMTSSPPGDSDSEFLLGKLARELGRYRDVTTTKDVNKGFWLRARYQRSSILVSVELAGRKGWIYRWGNQRDRSGLATDLSAIAAQIVALLKSRSQRRTVTFRISPESPPNRFPGDPGTFWG